MNQSNVDSIKQLFVSRQFLMFLLTGGTAAGINFGSRIIYNQWMSFSSSVILAYLTGIITAFTLTKLFVFKQSKQSTRRSILFFSLVNLIAILQTWTISLTLSSYLLPFIGVRFFVQEIAHAVGIAIPAFTSYYGHKNYSFKE